MGEHDDTRPVVEPDSPTTLMVFGGLLLVGGGSLVAAVLVGLVAQAGAWWFLVGCAIAVFGLGLLVTGAAASGALLAAQVQAHREATSRAPTATEPDVPS